MTQTPDSSQPSSGLRKVFSHQIFQIVYGVVLILMIPLVIILNTVTFVNNFSSNLDTQLQRQALLIGEIFNETERDNLSNPEKLTEVINAMAAASKEIYGFDVLYPEDDNFTVIASLDADSIGKQSTAVNNVLAWHEDKAIAQLTSSEARSIVAEPTVGNIRFWSVVLPLYDASGEKVALAHIKMSLEVMDQLAASTLFRSYILLILTVVIVILLLILNTRMFEYANLFRKLKEVDNMKDEFISIASHELRTPITALKGYVDMFMSGDFGKVNPAGNKGLVIMQSSIDRLGNLVEDLLNVSRIEQKRLQFNLQPTEIVTPLKLLTEELKVQADPKGLFLILEVPEALPKIMIDADKFKQIMINLVGNAIKYTKKGSVKIMVRDEAQEVVIKVKDTGIGMSAVQREHLFEKFYRVKSDETKGIIGTGLGLWITKQLVEAMKGHITVDSIEGVGTEFTVTFKH